MTANIVKTWIAEKEEAKEIGKQEEKLIMAKKFLLLGVSVEMVAEGTELSVEDVKKIKEELNL